MAVSSAGTSRHGRKAGVRIVVAGDRGTGKSSLIAAAASGEFPTDIPPVLPSTKLPVDTYIEGVPIIIIDTSSRLEDRDGVVGEFRKADVVVLTYSCDQSSTLENLCNVWLPELSQLEQKVPVIVVGCKLDMRPENPDVTLEEVMAPIMQQYREIETCAECSSVKQIQVDEVFYYAQKAVIHPTGPLFDQEAQSLKRQCINALKRIFFLCDHDEDGILSDPELNKFQIECFNTPLQPSEINAVKNVVRQKLPSGVTDRGLTLSGFLYLHALFIERGRAETTWTVLRRFEYDNDIRLRDDLLPSPLKKNPDQSIELSGNALKFLEDCFHSFSRRTSGYLHPSELDDLFSTAPDSVWSEEPYRDALECNGSGSLPLDSFLSQWALMAALDPARTVEYLMYIMYKGDPASAIRVTRRRSTDRKKKRTDRSVFQCFVFGPKNAGKSALLDAFLRRPFHGDYVPTYSDRYAANTVDAASSEGRKKTLVLREVPEARFIDVLSDVESLAACDVALFVYDSSDAESWEGAVGILGRVADHGDRTGYHVPCLIVSAKDDQDSYPNAIQNSTRVSQEMGMQAPIPVSVRLGDINGLFATVLSAAESPHLSIPETESSRARKHFQKLLSRSLLFASVGAAGAVVGITIYRVYLARKNASLT